MRLEPAEFNLLWRRLDLPARPLELNVPAQGATLAEAARLSARAAEALRRRDLLVRDDPAVKVAGLLNTVARPATQVDLRWARGGGVAELRGLVAVRGRSGVLALWDGESVTLRGVRSVAAPDELVAVLGESPPGAGRSVTTPAEAVGRASRESNGDAGLFQRRLVAAGVSRDDARVWRDVVEARRLRAGQIGATAYDQWGRGTRVPWVIHVLDTDRGRYATYERRGYRTIVGASTHWLVTVVRELHSEGVVGSRNR
ncbi:ESX secretion-associated protein EspG [Actinophytocola oryzae]|uniref:ESAT-6 protein secretion system EspG family protein n=1 Tax=Actinophytocola oryzae TaxID=502181 RepID=A0A4R7V9G7_9PSEU|nr:ESX secretion-associated protein EspG [Actinophytocola oryzae]TDV45567.1 ESAT-6 protein secretion system EspG family protein [Actinophytocola oryzae]